MTKTQQAKAHISKGDWKAALRIFKTFRHEFSRDEKRMVEIAYECITGKAAFYKQLGIDPGTAVETAKSIITAKYY